MTITRYLWFDSPITMITALAHISESCLPYGVDIDHPNVPIVNMVISCNYWINVAADRFWARFAIIIAGTDIKYNILCVRGHHTPCMPFDHVY